MSAISPTVETLRQIFHNWVHQQGLRCSGIQEFFSENVIKNYIAGYFWNPYILYLALVFFFYMDTAYRNARYLGMLEGID